MRTEAFNRFASSELCRSLQDGGKTPLTTHLLVGEKLGQNRQPITVLREHRRHPYRIVHAQTDEPAIEQIVMQLLH